MTAPEFLERDVVLFLHDQALREYGGIHGVKDEGLLDSALGRSPNKLAYADPPGPDLFDLATAYALASPATTPSTTATSARLGAAACCS